MTDFEIVRDALRRLFPRRLTDDAFVALLRIEGEHDRLVGIMRDCIYCAPMIEEGTIRDSEVRAVYDWELREEGGK